MRCGSLIFIIYWLYLWIFANLGLYRASQGWLQLSQAGMRIVYFAVRQPVSALKSGGGLDGALQEALVWRPANNFAQRSEILEHWRDKRDHRS